MAKSDNHKKTRDFYIYDQITDERIPVIIGGCVVENVHYASGHAIRSRRPWNSCIMIWRS